MGKHTRKRIYYTIEFCKNYAIDNGFELLSEEYIDSKNTKMKFKHVLCGDIFERIWGGFVSSPNCPKCSGKKRYTIEECSEFLENFGYSLLSKRYKNSQTKIIIRHNNKSCNYYEFKMTFDSFKNSGQRCPKCGGSARIKIEEVKESSFKRGYVLKTKRYKNNTTKMVFEHMSCGYIFKMCWRDFNSNHGCPKCGGKVSLSLRQVKKYSKDEGYVVLSKEFLGAKNKIKFKHVFCGYKFEMVWSSFYSAKQRCPYCAGVAKPTIEFCKKQAKNRGYDILDNEYTNAKTKMSFIHKKCSSVTVMSWSSFYTKKSGCRRCNQSAGEEKIEQYLIKNKLKEGKDYFAEHIFRDCFHKNFLLFDFYIPKLNVCIEFDGLQHFKAVKFKKDISDEKSQHYFSEQKIRDELKNLYCERNNIKMIRIPYNKYEEINYILETQIFSG